MAKRLDGALMVEAKSENSNGLGRSRTPFDLTHTNVEQLQRFVTDTGKILPRKITGLTARQQRHVTRAIKRARSMLLMK